MAWISVENCCRLRGLSLEVSWVDGVGDGVRVDEENRREREFEFVHDKKLDDSGRTNG